MATWDQLKIILARLADADPSPLSSWPDPTQDTGRPPPFRIQLAPWAVDVAGDLHARFGADVELTVGALRFPQRTRVGRPAGRARAPLPVADPAEIEITLDEPLRIRSGQLALGGLQVGNRGSRELQIGTSGELIATVVDPASGQRAGGYPGAVPAVLVTFTVAPGATERIPLLVATASFVPGLGYAVPAGEWGSRPSWRRPPGPRSAPRSCRLPSPPEPPGEPHPRGGAPERAGPVRGFGARRAGVAHQGVPERGAPSRRSPGGPRHPGRAGRVRGRRGGGRAQALHLHPRRADGAEPLLAADVGAAVAAVRLACPGVPVGVSTGLWITGGDPAARQAAVSEWAELPGAAQPDFASVNVSEPGLAALLAVLHSAGIAAEAGVWSAADASTLAALAPSVRWLRILVEVIGVPAARAVPVGDEIIRRLDELDLAAPRRLGNGPTRA